jgi:Putative Ig domain/Pectate lyase superfamily protein
VEVLLFGLLSHVGPPSMHAISETYSSKRLALIFVLGILALLNLGCAVVADPPTTVGHTVHKLAINTVSLPQGVVGTAYSVTLGATGGSAPYRWSIIAGALPAGLSLSSSGTISGIPSGSGTAKFTVQVQDSQLDTVSAGLFLAINSPNKSSSLQVATSSLSAGTMGKAYSASLAATGGTSPYQWSVTGGNLPSGLSLNASSGAISGSPSAAGTTTFTARVQDSQGQTAAANLSIVVNASSSGSGSPLQITTSSLSAGSVGKAYSASLAATGGTSPYHWSVTGGNLPSGLSLNASSGAISGSPSAAGTASFTIQVQDSKQQTASAGLSIAVSAAPSGGGGGSTLQITTSSLPAGTVGASYSTSLGASGGTPPYQWSVSAGSLPSGLSLNSGSGAISGTPSTSGSFNLTAKVQDSAQQSISANLLISISAAPTPASLSITTTSLPSGSVGSSYSAQLVATGGTAPYQWSVTAGSLPAGLTLNASTGAISGGASAAVNAAITVEARDSSVPQNSASKNFTLVISASGPPAGSVMVTTFGATGDGQTDDTKAINAAIGALRSGQTLFFPCGTYLVTAALTQLSVSNIQVLGPPSQCVTLHVKSSNSFKAFAVQGGISSSVNLAADVTSDTFTLVSGGVSSLGLNIGDYVMISDTAVNDNGSGSPPIATQEVVKVTAINGDTATIDGAFAWNFTMVSPHPEQWGGNPSAQKLSGLTNVIVKYIALDGTGSTGTIKPFRFDNVVNSEVGFVSISNFVSNAAGFDGFNPDTGYENNFHDLKLTNAANGPLPSGEGEAFRLQRQSYVTVNNVNIAASAGQGVFGFGYHDGYWGTLSNITIDLHGATGRVFKTLRADHNTFNNIVAMNGVGHNGINITDVSQFNVFNNCVATGNDQHGIDMFGSYDINNTFNNCTSKLNQGKQVNFSNGFSGQYADDNTTFNGGFFGDARGSGAIIQQNGVGFTMTGATISDDQGKASAGLVINGPNCSVTNNTFSGLPAGQDINMKSGTGCNFAGNSVPQGTTPSGLANLFKTAKALYASLTEFNLDNRRR